MKINFKPFFIIFAIFLLMVPILLFSQELLISTTSLLSDSLSNSYYSSNLSYPLVNAGSGNDGFQSRELNAKTNWTANEYKKHIDVKVIISASDSDIGCYELFEVELASTRLYSNPYTDVSLSAHFSGPLGKEINVNGYWYENNVYKIRVMPTAPGVWSFTTTSNDRDLNGVSGEFNCVSSLRPGILTVSTEYPYTFKLSEGGPFFWMGETSWCLMSNAVSYSDGTFQQYITKRIQQKFNNINFVLGTGGLPVGTHNPENEGGNLWISESQQQINPEFFKWMDKRIAYMDSLQMGIGFYITWAQHFAAFTRSEFERFESYLIARYAAFPIVYWVIVGEYDEAGSISDYNYHGQVIYEKDPYGHPISNHPNHSDAENLGTSRIFANQEWFSFVLQQLPQNPSNSSANEANNYIITDRIYNIPVVNSEFGYEGKSYNGIIMTSDMIRNFAWAIVMGGGFLAYGHDETIRTMNLNALESEGALYMGHLYDFFDTIDWWTMSPNNSKVNHGFCLSNSFNQTIVYLLNSGTVNVAITEDTIALQTQWYNPKNGTYNAVKVSEETGVLCSTSPYLDDAVLHIWPFSAPYIHVHPTSLTFTSTAGTGNPSIQTIRVTNTGGGSLSWTANEDPEESWIILDNAYGESGSHVIVSIDITGLSPGIYNGTIRINDSNAFNNPVEVPVSLSVSPPAPHIIAQSPNGGEDWTIGSNYTITWESVGTSGTVTIELSRDNGSSWEELFASTADDHSELWTVIGPTSNNCLIRVSDADGDPTDQSDAAFTITSGTVTQTISIKHGKLNMISFNIEQDNLGISIILDDLETLLVAQDDDGKFYIPPYGVNTIGNADLTNGYQVYITGSADDNVENEGFPLVPQDYSQVLTNTKLFMIGYPYQNAHPVEDVFTAIASYVVVVQDDEGQFWIPMYGVNKMGNMQPGKGYQIYVNQAVNFTYPEFTGELAKQGESATELSVPKHFQFEETGLPYAIVVTDSKQELSVGDEVGVFDGELCVGAAVFTGEYPLVIAAWKGNEEYELTGFKAGNPIILCVWKSSNDVELDVETSASATFHDGPISVMNFEALIEPVVIPTAYGLDQNYPNPFNPETVIKYQLPEDSQIRLRIYNLIGQQIRILVDEQKEAGYHQIKWDGKDASGDEVTSGIYLYTIQAGDFRLTMKLVKME